MRDPALIATIADELPVGVWVARAPDGAFVYANRAFESIMGMGPAPEAQAGGYAIPYGICGRNGKPYPEDQLPFARALRARANVVVDDIVIHRRDGRRVFIRAFARPLFDANGEILHVAIAFEDVTDQVETRERATLIEERLRHVIAHVPIILFALDCEGVVTLSEGRGLDKLGWRAESFLGRSVFELYRDQPDVLAHARRALAGEAFTSTASIGAVILETTFTPMRDATGEVSGVTGVSTDVTEREGVHGRLVETERLASMGTLSATMAHEINNPLTYVMANLDLLERHFEALRSVLPASLLADMTSKLADAKEGAERVRRIVRGLKTFSRQDEEPLGPIDLATVLDRSIAIAENELRRRARLVRDYARVPKVLANNVRLSQVFVNLLVNAAHAIPEGASDRHEIRVRTRVDGDTVVAEVEDTGAGIDDRVRARLFEPFFTTKPVGVGTGLGLSICYGIVKGFGGSIEVESTLGKGSVFRVRLPAAAPSEKARSAAEQPWTPPRRGRFLIVDDDDGLAKALGMLLETEHEVEVNTHPRRALDRLLGGTRFDLIFCDLMMPEMTGMDLYAHLAKKVPEQAERIVFMTGGAFTPAAQDFLDRVPNARLEKPFGKAQLEAIMRGRLEA